MRALEKLLKFLDGFLFGDEWEDIVRTMCKEAKAEYAQLCLDRGELTFRRKQFLEISDQLDEANENLLSMVNQYCSRTVRPDGTPVCYSHFFMSTGEAAFEYLVDHGLAKWCENDVDIYDLRFPSERPHKD